MHNNLTNSIRENYNRLADEYARRIYTELDHKPLDRELLHRFAADVAGHGEVCDMGCGPGHIARYLRDAGASVIGLDLSPRMLDEARRLNPDISFHEGNMSSLDLPDDSLVGITAFYAIVNIPAESLLPVFHEMQRVLQPGGLLLLAFHSGDKPIHVEEMLGRPVSMDFFRFQPSVIQRDLETAGFVIEDVIERDPYPEVEYQTRRAYLFARKPLGATTAASADRLKNKHSKHPPDQKQRNNHAHNVANPLASSLRSAKLKHAAQVGRTAAPFNIPLSKVRSWLPASNAGSTEGRQTNELHAPRSSRRHRNLNSGRRHIPTPQVTSICLPLPPRGHQRRNHAGLRPGLSRLAATSACMDRAPRMWNKNITELSDEEVAEANKILAKYNLRVTDIASPLFKDGLAGRARIDREPETRPVPRRLRRRRSRTSCWNAASRLPGLFETERIRCFDFWRLDDQKPYRDGHRREAAQGRRHAAQRTGSFCCSKTKCPATPQRAKKPPRRLPP